MAIRLAGKGLGLDDLNDGIMLLSESTENPGVFYDGGTADFAPVVETAEVNPLNPFSWFSGDADKAIEAADRGEVIEASGIAGKLLDRRARQAEAMRMLRGR
tara:strand:+ start:1743 stop:2048 length:306 start_codon:yes stop_codon:yes gene_type:complete